MCKVMPKCLEESVSCLQGWDPCLPYSMVYKGQPGNKTHQQSTTHVLSEETAVR